MSDADVLISNLLGEPDDFHGRGLANELLKFFLRGYPLDQLRLLIRNDNPSVAKAGIWIASEFPEAAPILLSDAIAVSTHADRYIRFFALDVIALAAQGDTEKDFVHIVKGLEDPDAAVSEHALHLLSRATAAQLRAAAKYLEQIDSASPHLRGLGLLSQVGYLNPEEIKDLIESSSSLERKYGLAIADRSYDEYPYLENLAASSQDHFISDLAKHLLSQHNAWKRR